MFARNRAVTDAKCAARHAEWNDLLAKNPGANWRDLPAPPRAAKKSEKRKGQREKQALTHQAQRAGVSSSGAASP
eukprot:8498539-Pyramimonas_sp.AAC.1